MLVRLNLQVLLLLLMEDRKCCGEREIKQGVGREGEEVSEDELKIFDSYILSPGDFYVSVVSLGVYLFPGVELFLALVYLDLKIDITAEVLSRLVLVTEVCYAAVVVVSLRSLKTAEDPQRDAVSRAVLVILPITDRNVIVVIFAASVRLELYGWVIEPDCHFATGHCECLALVEFPERQVRRDGIQIGVSSEYVSLEVVNYVTGVNLIRSGERSAVFTELVDGLFERTSEVDEFFEARRSVRVLE